MLSENQEYLKILADLIKIKSVNDHELEVAEYLKDLFQKNDIHSEILPIKGQRANLVAEIGSGAPVLAVSGHMDVVDPGNLAAWDSDPFTMKQLELWKKWVATYITFRWGTLLSFRLRTDVGTVPHV